MADDNNHNNCNNINTPFANRAIKQSMCRAQIPSPYVGLVQRPYSWFAVSLLQTPFALSTRTNSGEKRVLTLHPGTIVCSDRILFVVWVCTVRTVTHEQFHYALCCVAQLKHICFLRFQPLLQETSLPAHPGLWRKHVQKDH